VDRCGQTEGVAPTTTAISVAPKESTTLYPPQWVQCDLRYLDMTVLGLFSPSSNRQTDKRDRLQANSP
jgi:hypothetical protein